MSHRHQPYFFFCCHDIQSDHRFSSQHPHLPVVWVIYIEECIRSLLGYCGSVALIEIAMDPPWPCLFSGCIGTSSCQFEFYPYKISSLWCYWHIGRSTVILVLVRHIENMFFNGRWSLSWRSHGNVTLALIINFASECRARRGKCTRILFVSLGNLVIRGTYLRIANLITFMLWSFRQLGSKCPESKGKHLLPGRSQGCNDWPIGREGCIY